MPTQSELQSAAAGQPIAGQTVIPIDATSDSVQATQQKLGADIANLEKSVRVMEEKIAKDKINFVEFCGIFVAIFTFISIEIQILRWICDFYKIIGFTLVFGSMLIGFIFVLDFLVDNSNKWIEQGRLSSYAVRFSLVGILLLFLLFLGLNQISKGSKDWRCNEGEQNPVIENSPTNTYQFPSTVNLRLTR